MCRLEYRKLPAKKSGKDQKKAIQHIQLDFAYLCDVQEGFDLQIQER